jgi:hypothetical protein
VALLTACSFGQANRGVKEPLIVRKGSIMSVDRTEMNGMFVVEWNRRQKHFHIQALGEILRANLLAAVNGRDSGYVPLAIAQTKEAALEMSNLIEVKLKSLRPLHRVDGSDTLQ